MTTSKQPDPCGPESCSPGNGSGPDSWLGKVLERHVFRKRQANSRGSGPPKESGPPRKSRTPHGSRTTCIITGPLTKGRSRHPASRWSGADTCLQAQTRIQGRLVSILSLTHHCIHCGRWTSALMQQKPRRFFDQGALLIAYYQGA